jgi:tetratricopeptide (TPR) repeat protein
MRLKILVMPCSEANPVGKNADYFFLKGFKFGACDEHANAMASYLKGLDIKNDHLLCRFNLGVTLFKLGLFEESVHQYEILAKQHSGKPVVLYNKALCELQAGKFEEASLSAEKCIEEIMKKSKNLKSNTSQERNHISSNSTT